MNFLRNAIIASGAIAGLFSLIPAPASAQNSLVIGTDGGFVQTSTNSTSSSVIYYDSRPSIDYPNTIFARPDRDGRFYPDGYYRSNFDRYPRVRESNRRPVIIHRHRRDAKPVIIQDNWHHRARFRNNSRVIIIPTQPRRY